MTRDEAEKVAEEVLRGQPKSFVEAAKALTKYVLGEYAHGGLCTWHTCQKPRAEKDPWYCEGHRKINDRVP